MKAHSYRFTKMQKWLGPTSFAALHISHEYAYYIKLARQEYDLAFSSFAKIRIHNGAISLQGLANENVLTTGLRELKKHASLTRIVLVVPSSVHTPTFGPKEIKREKDAYKKAATRAGFSVSNVLYEEEALRFKLKYMHAGEPELFVNIGARETNIMIASHGSVVGSKLSTFGGESLALLVARTYGMSEHDAEVIKREKGLKTGKDGKVLSVLVDAAHYLKEDIERATVAWYAQMKKVSGNHEVIHRIILAGSESMLPGLSEYLAHSLRLQVHYADAWQGILDVEKYLPELSKKDSLDYIYALGGVMSELSH